MREGGGGMEGCGAAEATGLGSVLLYFVFQGFFKKNPRVFHNVWPIEYSPSSKRP